MRKWVCFILFASLALAACGNSSQEDVVREFVTAWENKNPDQINRLLCDEQDHIAPDFFATIESVEYNDLTYEEKGVDKTQAQIRLTGEERVRYAEGDDTSSRIDKLFVLHPANGGWCIYDIEPDPTPGAAP